MREYQIRIQQNAYQAQQRYEQELAQRRYVVARQQYDQEMAVRASIFLLGVELMFFAAIPKSCSGATGGTSASAESAAALLKLCVGIIEVGG